MTSLERSPLLGAQQPTTHSTPLRRTAYIAGAFLSAGGAAWAVYNTWKNWSGGGTVNNIATSIEAFALAACACIVCIAKARTPLRTRSIEEASPLLNDVTSRTHDIALGEIDGRLAAVATKHGATIEVLSSEKTLVQLIEAKIAAIDTFLQAVIAERDQTRTSSEEVLKDFSALKERCKTLLPQLAITSPSSAAHPTASPAAPATLSPVDAEALRKRLFEELDTFESGARVKINSTATSAASTPQRAAPVSSAPGSGTKSPLGSLNFGSPAVDGKEN